MKEKKKPGDKVEKKDSIFKRIRHFIGKNRKSIFLILLSLCVMGASVFLLYKLFFNPANEEKIYENFRVTNVMTKEKSNRNIPNDSTFFIETDERVNVESVKNHIYISPSIDYEIKKINSKKYELIPLEELVDNQVYSIEEVQNETSTYKWAFETERKLVVTNYTENLEKNETIKINFSMDNVEDINDYVSISPSVDGTWKKHNSTWVYENTEAFQNGTDYKVHISNGVRAGKYELEDGYSFTVSCYYEGNSQDTMDLYPYTMDSINTFTSKEQVKSTIISNEWERIDNESVVVHVYKFNKLDEFKKTVTKEKKLNLKSLENVYTKEEKIQNSVVALSKNLNNGYYIIEFNCNGKKMYQYVQISDIQAYQITTERDLLVWTIKNGKPASNIEVEYNGKTLKSNKDGLVKFENINNKKLNNSFITIDKSSKNPIVILTSNFDKNNYPNGYIYTDRPIYKSTDTIQVWGYIAVSDFIDKIENKFTIQYGNLTKKIKVNENGTFTTTIKLNNHVDNDSFDIALCYDDAYIAQRSISIYNYTEPTYTYTIDMNKHIYYAGDTIEFDVLVKHMTGLTAKNKKVKVVYNNKKYSAKTNDQGIAHFKIKTNYDRSNDFQYEWGEIDVYTGDDEEDFDSYQAIEYVEVYNHDININATTGGKNGNYNLTIQANKIDFKKTEENRYYSTALGDKYNKEATIEIYKNTLEKVINGSYYDDIEGKMVDNIDYIDSDELVDTKKVTLKDGKATLTQLKYTESYTEDKDINYYAVIQMKDTNNRIVKETVYFYYNDDMFYNNEDYIQLYSDSMSTGRHNYQLVIHQKNQEDFYSYKANENETIDYSIMDKSGKKVDINGQLLTVFYKEKILDSNIKTSDDLNFKFNKKYIPGIYLAAAYLKDGKVYSVASTYVDYDETNKEAKVVIKTNKEKYKPGEEVETTVKVVDKNGKALKTDVNLSVVDKAIFEIAEDNTDILSNIYMDRWYAMYQVSTGRDYYFPNFGGRGGSGQDKVRFNFKDTAYFDTATTNKNGEIKFKFKLPDNITSYRLTVHSANQNGYVGVNTAYITVTKDFFIESPVPQGVKYSDDLVVNAISHGQNAKDEVQYTFEIDGKKLETKAKVDQYATVNFGKLSVGKYDLKITAQCGEYKDSMINTVSIVGNTQEVPVKTTTELNEKTNIKTTKNPIILEIYDKKLDSYLKYIEYLGNCYSSRLDKRIGIYEADRLTRKFTQEKEFSYGNLSEYIYQDTELVSTTPNGKNKDVLLSAVVNQYTPNYFNSYYDNGFEEVLMNETTMSRDYYSAILGLAANHKMTLSQLDTLKNSDKDRDYLETILLGNAYGFLGDYETAKEIYHTLKVTVKDYIVSINDKKVDDDDISGMLAILSSMVDKNMCNKIIDGLIHKKSTTMYLNFAIIAYIENNTENIDSNKSVTIHYGTINQKVTIRGFLVEKISLDNKELKNLTFKNASKDLQASYYYATGIDEVDSKNIKKDVRTTIAKNVKKNTDLPLTIQYTNSSKDYIDLRIAIPNGLSLDKESLNLKEGIYLKSYKNTYATISISTKVKNVNLKIPFIAVNEGKYVFEPVVIFDNGTYHISSKMDITIK